MDEFQDNKTYIIGSLPTDSKKRRSLWKVLLIIALAVLVVALVVVSFLWGHTSINDQAKAYGSLHQALSESLTAQQADNPHPLQAWLEESDAVSLKTCLVKDSVVNDIPIRIYLPLNATARLQIGSKCLSESTTLLVAEAADIRADNGKINGAFVLAGTPKAWGLSKKAYCAIIHDSIQVGVSDNSPLFEQACETGGYFFRQYALVKEGQVVLNQLKTQARRRALCEIDGHIVLVETFAKIGLYDFSQLLVDIYTVNAINLIGGETLGFAKTIDGETLQMGDSTVDMKAKQFKNTNYIYWQ